MRIPDKAWRSCIEEPPVFGAAPSEVMAETSPQTGGHRAQARTECHLGSFTEGGENLPSSDVGRR